MTARTPGSSLGSLHALENTVFQAGGTLRKDALYVRRAADGELASALLRREFCYILAPRQIGKSSLRVRTEAVLEELGVRCVSIDLTTIGGKGSSAAEWYFGLLDETARQLGLHDPAPFWLRHGLLSPVQRWVRYLHQEVSSLASPVVLFIDEIDAVLAQPAVSRDEFIAAIRAIYNARANDDAYEYITFCLFGVATPGDLIRDENSTPFNIGRAILLSDFQRAEMSFLAPGLQSICSDPEELIEQIFGWTSGHPYMTQKFCQHLAEQAEAITACEDAVGRAAAHLFLRRGRTLEPSLAHVEQCFARDSRLPRVSQMLRLYRQLLAEDLPPVQNNEPVQLGLRIAGLAAERQGPTGPVLVVRNRIFATLFDTAWVSARERERRFSDQFVSWQEGGHPQDYLLRGEALHQALSWAEGREDILSEERAFLIASVELARSEEVERERRARLESERRLSQRQLRILITALGMLIVALGIAVWQYRAALTAQRQLEASIETERGMRAASLAKSPGQMLQALVTGMQAMAPSLLSNRAASAQATEGLLAAMEGAAAVPSTLLRGHKGAIYSSAISPDGRQVVTGSKDGTVRIWDAVTGQLLRDFMAHAGGVLAASYSRDGKRLATGGIDHHARVWDVESGRLLTEFAGHDKRITKVSFSPDDQRVVSSSDDTTARIWDSRTGLEILALRGHSLWVSAASFSPDGKHILTASYDRTTRLWDAVSGQELGRFLGPISLMRDAAFSPDGKYIAACAEDESAAYVWDVKTGRLLHTLRGHASRPNRAVFSPDSRQLVTASSDHTARMWDVESGHLLLALEGHASAVRTVAFSPDGQTVLTGSDDGSARIWHLAQVKRLPVLKESSAINFARYSPDGQEILTVSGSGMIARWKARSGALIHRWKGHECSIISAQYSSDGKRAVTSDFSGRVLVWDVATASSLLQIKGHSDRIDAARFSPDEARLATASCDETAAIWDVASGRELLRLRGHIGRLFDIHWSPSGHQIITAGEDGTARVWDAQSGRELLRLSGHQGQVHVALYSPDGKRIATGGTDHMARVFDAKTGKQLQLFAAHVNSIYSLAYSRDGQRLLTAGADHRARIWDTSKARLLLTLAMHENTIRSATFSPDGMWMVTGSDDGTARIMPTDASRLFSSACEMFGALYAAGHEDLRSEPGLSELRGVCAQFVTSKDRPESEIWQIAP